MKINFSPYDPNWPVQFANEREQIGRVIGANAVSIEHIGSTAVPGLAAKPILDIQVGVADLSAFDRSGACARLEELGYLYRKDLEEFVPYRRFFARRDSAVGPDAQIHLVEKGHPWHDRHLLFRDYLRANDAARERYHWLKLGLAERDWPDIHGYTDAKTDLILALEEEAFAHFGLSDEERQRTRDGRVS